MVSLFVYFLNSKKMTKKNYQEERESESEAAQEVNKGKKIKVLFLYKSLFVRSAALGNVEPSEIGLVS